MSASSGDDARWLAAAAALAERARPLSRPNPAVGAIIVNDGIVVGRGWTQPGGRPHAEAAALAQAGDAARGATLYVTLEPCAHRSERGPACADLIAGSGLARAVVGMRDIDRRTEGKGIERLLAAGIAVEVVDDRWLDEPRGDAEAEPYLDSLRDYVRATHSGYPGVTLKLAMTSDGFIARPDGTSKWITGEAARAHVHRERARADAILVGRGTYDADRPSLDVRLPGLEDRSPEKWLLTRGEAPPGWKAIADPMAVGGLGIRHLLVEGGAGAADAFLSAGLVSRLLLYRSPITFGEGIPAFRNPGPSGVPAGWRLADRRQLGSDTLEVYYPA